MRVCQDAAPDANLAGMARTYIYRNKCASAPHKPTHLGIQHGEANGHGQVHPGLEEGDDLGAGARGSNHQNILQGREGERQCKVSMWSCVGVLLHVNQLQGGITSPMFLTLVSRRMV